MKFHKGKPCIWPVLLGRIAVILLMAAQLALFFFMLFYWCAGYKFVSILLNILSFFTVIYVLNAPIKNAYKLTWSLMILAAPLFGGALFLLLHAGKKLPRLPLPPPNPREAEAQRGLRALHPACAMQAAALSRAGYPLYGDTAVTYLPSGKEKFKRLKQALLDAHAYIYLEYFIICQGRLWSELLEILEQKAAEGVEIKLIYDDMGCFLNLPGNFQRRLRRAGIQTAVFSRFRPWPVITQNSRDHRKIAVIDGCVGFTGGINIGDEYINIKKRFDHWKDSAVMLEGGAVRTLTALFLNMWNALTREQLPLPRMEAAHAPGGFAQPCGTEPADTPPTGGQRAKAVHAPGGFAQPCGTEPADTPPTGGRRAKAVHAPGGFVQPYGAEPMDPSLTGEQVYLNLIGKAQRYLYITTPYLIPDEAVLCALKNSARCGVDVRIITPHHPDKWYVYLMAHSYYPELLAAGVRIYEYERGFIHSKCMVSDDVTAAVGTMNLDYRSMYVQYECGCLFHCCDAVTAVRDDILQLLPSCIEMREVPQGRLTPHVQRLLRLFAPLM